MKFYSLSRMAERDALGIFRYSLRTWGIDQANRYRQALIACIERMAGGEAVTSRFTAGGRQYLQLHCRHHHIIAFRTAAELRIIAILHERMDLVTRIAARLKGGQP
ncbi:toxin ParE1/3/4 [Novosphingobium sp. CF614]|uniref:type II toxin-antitoxin system RelE/ParE family toxin n=1 Tax=Novosphingobium sp. CF614 TaxID=1884364 RepID=UPI0008E7B3B4|nr:type II toxin-antitoxin system RelE/ParE family toxin [Novosphingobium sp. CF614]SFG20901.1 toxin ParE1/3/4 [Novosphingobium sp. CF614]